MERGVLYVMTTLASLKPGSYATSCNLLTLLLLNHMHTMVPAMVQFGWTMWPVLALNTPCFSAQTLELGTTTAHIERTLELYAQVSETHIVGNFHFCKTSTNTPGIQIVLFYLSEHFNYLNTLWFQYVWCLHESAGFVFFSIYRL